MTGDHAPATFEASRRQVLTGRSWSGNGWLRWELPWRPSAAGPAELLARATDSIGVTQPDVAPYNTLGYRFGAVVRHPVTVA